MKKQMILGGLLVLGLMGCQSKDNNTIPFKSPYTFVYDANLKNDVAAQVESDEISSSQLYSPSPALQEIEDRINKIVLIKVYEKALASDVKSETQIVYGFAQPKEELAKILGAKLNKSLAVTFDENLKAAAQLNGAVITRAELAKEDTLMARLMDSGFEQKLQAIEGLITRRKILQASKDANTPMEEYIQKNILKGSVAATDAEVLEFAQKNNITEKELTEELKAQLKDTIQARRRDQLTAEYVAKNIVKTPIKVSFSKPTMKIDLPSVGDAAPHKGTGPIEIALFSYLQCENCKSVTQALSELAESNPKYFRVSYVFNFAENNNEERMVAEAAMCLSKQKDQFFWDFPQALKKSENTSLEENINAAVKSMGADFDGFRTCFLNREYKDKVETHLQSTKNLGFYKTPVVVMDGVVLETPIAGDLVEKAMEMKAEKGLGFNFIYKIKKFFRG